MFINGGKEKEFIERKRVGFLRGWGEIFVINVFGVRLS